MEITSQSTLFVKFHNDNVKQFYTVNKNHEYDAGFNIYIPNNTLIPSKKCVLVDTHVSANFSPSSKIDSMYYCMYPRSSIYKTPLIMQNSVGIIDVGYTGEIKIPLFNLSDSDYEIKSGTSLTQLVHPRGNKWNIVETDNIAQIDSRGVNGFGSTD